MIRKDSLRMLVTKSKTMLTGSGSALLTGFISPSDDRAKTKRGANPGDAPSPPGDNRATNLPPSQTSTSCVSVSRFAAFRAGGITRVIGRKILHPNKTLAVNTEDIGSIISQDHVCRNALSRRSRRADLLQRLSMLALRRDGRRPMARCCEAE